ncbi:hypothetical protein RU84_14185 [Acinetobacter baumannii]|uniref:hypothetical protein n=1 Tax=Acinetobacter baumannii TaxID=470 RepID=UPI00057E46E4|nr:hypothetical protein [Acinetobacter baumannii]AJB67977.1 hypothetical protein RU84_14185 [Acinetobacter baumannii]
MDEFEEYYKNSEWFGTYQSDLMMKEAFEAGQQSIQAKVEELEKQLSEYIFVSETLDEMYVKEVKSSEELQKRVDKAIRFLVEAELYQSEPNIDLAVKALKGEG